MKKIIFILFFTSIIFNSVIVAQVIGVDAIGFTVKEMDRSVKFYTEVLGFKKISDTELAGTEYERLQGIFGLRLRVVRLQLGEEFIELTDYLTSGGRSIPEDAKSNDLIFQHIAIVVSSMEQAYQQLRRHKVMHVSTGPQTIPASNLAAAGVKAFYFHDPDMHNLELIYFPKGKGLPKWQQPNGKLFLGIDHTAIGISDTDSSLSFYENLLGFERKGDSWNKGTEQAHLNFVENASLHITGLRVSQGPGIEFLQYLVPGPGKPFPSDSKADDIWHWQTTLLVNDAEAFYKKLNTGAYKLVSIQPVILHDKSGRKSTAFIIRDRDGHSLLIRQPFH
jgi:catechol 2,3-dioxygenase-like lactoylglutathione lyase family enzyme